MTKTGLWYDRFAAASCTLNYPGPFTWFRLSLTGTMSLTNMDHRLSWNFVGLDNYKAMLQDTIFNRVFWNTLLYVFGTLLCFNVTFGLLLALATSYIAERQAERTSMFFRALWLLPRFTPPIVYGVIWLWILDPTRNGLLNGILNFFGRQTCELDQRVSHARNHLD